MSSRENRVFDAVESTERNLELTREVMVRLDAGQAPELAPLDNRASELARSGLGRRVQAVRREMAAR